MDLTFTNTQNYAVREIESCEAMNKFKSFSIFISYQLDLFYNKLLFDIFIFKWLVSLAVISRYESTSRRIL